MPPTPIKVEIARHGSSTAGHFADLVTLDGVMRTRTFPTRFVRPSGPDEPREHPSPGSAGDAS